MAPPSITSVLIGKDHERFAGDAIESILGQSLLPSQVLLVDADSKDQTFSIMKKAERENPGLVKAVKISRPSTVVAVLQSVAPRISGEFLAINSLDDWCHPERFERLASALSRFAYKPGLVFSDGWFANQDGRVTRRFFTLGRRTPETFIQPEESLRRLLRGNWIYAPTVLTRSDLFCTAISKVDPDAVFEDYPVWLELAREDGFLFVPEALIYYRQVASSLSRNPSAQVKMIEDETVLLKEALHEFPLFAADVFLGALKLSRRAFHAYLAKASPRLLEKTLTLALYSFFWALRPKINRL